MGILQNALGPGYNCYLRPSQILSLKNIKLITYNCTLETLTLFEKIWEIQRMKSGGNRQVKRIKIRKRKKSTE